MFGHLASALVDQVAMAFMNHAYRDRPQQCDPVDTRHQVNELPDTPQELYGRTVRAVDLASKPGASYPVGRQQQWRVLQYDSQQPLGIAANDRVRAHWAPPPGSDPWQSPTAIVIHGYRQGRFTTFFRPLVAALHGIGWGAAMLELPFHVSRIPAGDEPGERLINCRPSETIRAVSQAVVDVRVLAASLRHMGAPEVAVLGVSLGGYVAALTGVVEPDLEHLIMAAPVVDPVDVVWHCPLLRDKREAMAAANIAPHELAVMLRPVSPVSHTPACAPENILLIQAVYDLIARKETIERLATRWGVQRHHRLRMGHFVYALLAHRHFDLIIDFLQRARPAGRRQSA
jgi:pimeloyl-ACP methyl ester carboxylesterase